jgi:hypothetical protein
VYRAEAEMRNNGGGIKEGSRVEKRSDTKKRERERKRNRKEDKFGGMI